MITEYKEKFQKQEELNEELFAKIRKIVSTLERNPSKLEGKSFFFFLILISLLLDVVLILTLCGRLHMEPYPISLQNVEGSFRHLEVL